MEENNRYFSNYSHLKNRAEDESASEGENEVGNKSVGDLLNDFKQQLVFNEHQLNEMAKQRLLSEVDQLCGMITLATRSLNALETVLHEKKTELANIENRLPFMRDEFPSQQSSEDRRLIKKKTNSSSSTNKKASTGFCLSSAKLEDKQKSPTNKKPHTNPQTEVFNTDQVSDLLKSGKREILKRSQ
jgi:hypothetical protein